MKPFSHIVMDLFHDAVNHAVDVVDDDDNGSSKLRLSKKQVDEKYETLPRYNFQFHPETHFRISYLSLYFHPEATRTVDEVLTMARINWCRNEEQRLFPFCRCAVRRSWKCIGCPQ